MSVGVDTGGSAGPYTEYYGDTRERIYQQHEGASLLDVFAAHAMRGLLNLRSTTPYDGLADEAYRLGAAMIRARNRVLK